MGRAGTRDRVLARLACLFTGTTRRSGRRICGVLGGAFAPPSADHLGFLRMAKEAGRSGRSRRDARPSTPDSSRKRGPAPRAHFVRAGHIGSDARVTTQRPAARTRITQVSLGKPGRWPYDAAEQPDAADEALGVAGARTAGVACRRYRLVPATPRQHAGTASQLIRGVRPT
jgi:hypothetical protein